MYTPMIIGADGILRITVGAGIPGTRQDGVGDGAGTLITEATGMLDGDGTLLTMAGVGIRLTITVTMALDGDGTTIIMAGITET